MAPSIVEPTADTQNVGASRKSNSSEVKSNNFAAIAAGGYSFAGIPIFENLLEKRQWQLEHMAGAFRVFFRKGFSEGTSGHISVRDPIDTNTFWINPLGKHFGMMTAADMVQVDENGRVIGGNKVAVNAAGFMIHSAIHKARPDIHAACHAHSVHGKAWSAFVKPLEIINQDVCTFWKAHSVYESFGGIALEEEEGKRIAATLGANGGAAVLQNHGLLTVGSTVDEAAYLFTLLERPCQVQLLADAAGLEKMYINDEEAEYTQKVTADRDTLYTEFQPDFEYEVWQSHDCFICRWYCVGPGGVEVTSSKGIFFAKKVIVSVPSPVYKTITFEPALPFLKQLLTSSSTSGYYTKVMVVFKTAFWVTKRFCGLSQSFLGPAAVIRDTSVPADNKWILTCFLVGDPGLAWSKASPAEQKDSLLDQIAKLFADRETVDEKFVELLGHEWSTEQHSGYGCPCTSLPPGVLATAGDALREPHGNIHFVGTETSGEWKGYMEGAVRNGERGAAEVLSCLSRASARL